MIAGMGCWANGAAGYSKVDPDKLLKVISLAFSSAQ